ncbi:MAG: hypothetical protein JXX28_14145 [Deltaproteobacteria bacterium]|nr:hypothetical protein [Deltaproteobacteria bacterium]
MSSLGWPLLLLVLAACGDKAGTPELLCNGLDDDADGIVDDGLGSEDRRFYPDEDGDHYGDSQQALWYHCEMDGYVPQGGDCDDTDPHVAPHRHDDCDLIDNDCDGKVDEGFHREELVLHPDGDGDGYGRDDRVLHYHCPVVGYAEQGGDCDDTDSNIHPDADERCNLADDDCDGAVDEGLEDGEWLIYLDADGDRWGDSDQAVTWHCLPTRGWVETPGDCDDTDQAIRPGAVELCDDIDSDCDGDLDDAFRYLDLDQDGWGDEAVTTDGCATFSPVMWAAQRGDCDPLDPFTYPGADELCDGVDRNCNGERWEGPPEEHVLWFPDTDGDGYGDGHAEAVLGCGPPDGQGDTLPLDCDDSTPGRGSGLTLVREPCEEGPTGDEMYRYDRSDCPFDKLDFEGQGPWTWRAHNYSCDGVFGTIERTLNEDCLPVQSVVTSADGTGGSVSTWQYNDEGQPLLRERWTNGVFSLRRSWTYADDGQLLLAEEDNDGDGVLDWWERYTYDEEGRTILHEVDEDGDGAPDQVEQWVYDEDGTLVLESEDTDGDGVPERYKTYDPWGELLEEYYERDGSATCSYERQCSWDPTGLARTCTVDHRCNGVDGMQWYTYDRLGRLLHLEEDSPLGGELDRELVNTWGPTGHLSRQWESTSTRGTDERTYDEAGRLVEELHATSSEETWSSSERWAYDLDGRLISREYHRLSGYDRTERERWSYHPDGTVASTYESITNSYFTGETTRLFDQQGRLTQQKVQKEDQTYRYLLHLWYDEAGRQVQGRLVIPQYATDVTFPITHPDGRVGAISWDIWDVYQTSREGGGWSVHGLELYDADDPMYENYPLRSPAYDNGVLRYTGFMPAEVLFHKDREHYRSGLERTVTKVCDLGFEDWELLEYGTFSEGGHRYDRTVEVNECWDPAASEYSWRWVCME